MNNTKIGPWYIGFEYMKVPPPYPRGYLSVLFWPGMCFESRSRWLVLSWLKLPCHVAHWAVYASCKSVRGLFPAPKHDWRHNMTFDEAVIALRRRAQG